MRKTYFEKLQLDIYNLVNEIHEIHKYNDKKFRKLYNLRKLSYNIADQDNKTSLNSKINL
jgi:hypothetical protein